jgi:hypothetical protein
MPARPDQIAETVALTVDTALAVRARFGDAVDYVDRISFDHASHGMSTGKIAGAAAHIQGLIHLNASYCFVEGVEVIERARQARIAEGRPAATSAEVPTRWTVLDGIVSHELWHKIELAWEARRYRETMDFRREIGSWLGVRTLEEVFDVPAARATLAAGVSAYAATARLEATAEMFKLWWCGPPPPGSLAARFGDLVERNFPRTPAQ